MSVRVSALEVDAADGNGGHVKISRGTVDRVVVTWFCGDTRTFTPDDLRAMVNMLDKLAVVGDVPLRHKDTHGHMVCAAIIDGNLHADTHLRESMATTRYVPWPDMKNAIRRMLAA